MSDLFDVSKEIILVTGASQGLGRQFARVLSAHGAAVVLAARQTAKLKSLEDEIRGQGGRAVAVQIDVTDIASIGTAIDSAEAALGPVSVTCTPSAASAIAQARPKPLLDAHTIARRPLIPRSTVSLPSVQMIFISPIRPS